MMNIPATEHADILMGDVPRLEDVLNRDAASSVCRSFFELFRVPVRVISREGNLLADVHHDQRLCRYVNEFLNGKTQCASVVEQARDHEPETEAVTHPCFTGAVYRIGPVSYQGRTLGRIVLGPFVPAETSSHPDALLAIDQSMDPSKTADAFARMPRARKEVADQLLGHLTHTLHLLIFSGHKAQLATTMQIANVRENYRELAEKTAKLETAYEELKELDRMKSTFLATVSHELRTPLTSIIGYGDMLQGDQSRPLHESQVQHVQAIRTRADQLLEMVDNLIDLGRLGVETLDLSAEPVCVHTLLRDVVSTVTPAAERKNIAVAITGSTESLVVKGDPPRLAQIVLNLVQNAIKFTPRDGTVELTAATAELRKGGGDNRAMALFSASKPAVAITVQDSGPGIPQSEHERIFQAFYQCDGTTRREHGGAGLGLSIVRQLVQLHGGRVEVDSPVGGGAIFVVTLPATDGD